IKLPIPKLIRPNQRWLTLIWQGLKLRRHHFDLVLDSSNKNYKNWRLFKWLAGGERVLDYFTSPVQPFGAPHAHGSTHEQAILKLLGVKNPDASYDLPVPPKDQQEVQTWLDDRHITTYILLNPSGSVDKRRFSAHTLQGLAKKLAPFNVPLIVPSAPTMYVHWQQATQAIPNMYVKQTKSIFELFEWVRRANWVLTPDTSVVHIAAGFGKPCLVFYNTLSVYNAPNNPRAQIVETDRKDVNRFNWADVDKALEKLSQVAPEIRIC
ncbi:MAG: glycosyltransferase family 9 protein, partial [Elusimicrobiaceae bacterium]|nr:glycosyltransferase family 9 protein [Elusimicrobiaceae bacterium]